MADSEQNLPELYTGVIEPEEFHVSELLSENSGSMSPFGDDLEFPIPVDKLSYIHPGPAERPHLAGGH
jgi:hypothetical protein